MSNKLITSLELLKSSIASQNVRRAAELLENVCRHLDDDLSISEKELSIHKIFDESIGLLGFLLKSIRANKLFKDCNITILKLIKQIIDEQKQQIQQYARQTIKVMRLYMRSTVVTAKEKELSVLIVQSLVAQNLCQDVVDLLSQIIIDSVHIFNLKKPTGRFLQCCYELIGMIARDYPAQIPNDYDVAIRDLYFKTLENTLLNQGEISFQALTGSLNGFAYFLVNFAPSSSDEPNTYNRLYTCIKKLSDPTGIRDHMTFRASLNLLATHSTLFAEHLFHDNQFWHTILLKWLSLPTWEDRKTAIFTIHSFHREIAGQIQARACETDSIVLQFFINYFRTTLESQTAESFEIRIAICGFGLMAGPCKVLLPDHLPNLLNLVIQRTEYAIRTHNGRAQKEILEHYPDYVRALSQIMEQCSELTGVQIASLQNIIIALMKDFYLLSYAHHERTIRSLMVTFQNLSRLGGSILADCLERVVLQGVVWTCSHKLVYDSQEDWQTITDWKENITYQSFMPLWKGFLTDREDGTDFDDRPMITGYLYEHVMRTLFTILDKLDLSLRKRIFTDETGIDQELYFCDPNYDLMPVNGKDFHIFFNIVDFYRDLLNAQTQSSHEKHFTKWIKKFCEYLMVKSIKNPLISGYLKLLKVGITIGNRIKFFDSIDDNEQNLGNFFNTIKYFLRNLIGKVGHASGELKIACLVLLLTLPTSMLSNFIYDIVPIFIIAFEIGHSMLYVANTALTALQKLTESLDPVLQEFLLQKILPTLEPYLQSKEQTAAGKFSVEIMKLKMIKRARKTFKSGGDNDTELLQFQKRIVSFLGTLEPTTCLYFISGDIKQENLVKMDIDQNIRLKLHNPILKPTIYLDILLPRICSLATTSSQRATKLAACELLHASILYLIGINKHEGKVWRELCRQMLVLGADVDVAVQQIFEPLLMQIIHYLSQRSQLHTAGVEILIDCLMEGISHQTNSTVRDMSARCLREFLSWTIKQTTRAQLNSSPVSIELLLSKLKLYSFESNKYKRKGSALAFNNLYRILREEEVYVDVYWLELLHVFLINFVLTEELNPENGVDSYDEVTRSLDHIARVVHDKRELFNRPNDSRRVPKIFAGSTIRDAMVWLFGQCANRNMKYRLKCISLFVKLTPCITGIHSIRSFISDTQTADSIVEMIEGSVNGVGLKGRPDLTHLKSLKQSSITGLYIWLQQLLCALDCYTWLIGDNLLIAPNDILRKSMIFHVIVYYLEKICFRDIYEIITSDSVDDSAQNIDFKNDLESIYKIEIIKCFIVDRLFEFLQKLVPHCASNVPPYFWNGCTPLCELLQQILFAPQNLELDYVSIDGSISLSDRVCGFLELTLPKLAPNFAQNLTEKLIAELMERLEVTNNVAEMMLHTDSVPIKESNAVKGILNICRKHERFSFIDNDLKNAITDHAKAILRHLFDGISEEYIDCVRPVQLKPEQRMYAYDLIEIALIFVTDLADVLSLMLNETILRKDATTSITHGQHFVESFKGPIFNYFLKTPEETIAWLSAKITTENINYVVKIFTEFLLFVYKYKQHDHLCLKTIVNSFLRQWPMILMKIAEPMQPITSFILVDFLSHLALICPYQLYDIQQHAIGLRDWILSIISNEQNSLELKSRCLFLLPCILGQMDTEDTDAQAALAKIQLQYFPLKSAEFPVGSLQRSAFENMFKMILDAAAASKSPTILKFIINATAADQKHILEWAIQECLSSFMAHQTADNQVNSLCIPYELFCNDSVEPLLRLSIAKRFLLSMIKRCSVDAIIRFYAEHIKAIVSLADSNYAVGSCGWKVEQALVNRIGAFQLIELLVGSIKKEQIQDRNCPIGAALLGADNIKVGTEIFGFLTRKAFAARSDIFITDDGSASELFRVYQCAAYNAICALISNTQDTLVYYKTLLFKENPTKNEYIWRKIINTTNENLYNNFTAEFDDYPKMKERIVSIRQIEKDSAAIKRSANYLQSQTVFDSSLSQDITKMDLSFSVVRTKADVVAFESAQSTAHISLENTDLNNHEVMPVLCAVIQHMYESGITPIDDDPRQRARVAPEWASSIAHIIGDSNQSKNIRIFLVKLVENCRNIFRHYARTMTRSVLQFLADECAGPHLNHFNTDLIVALLEWCDVYKMDTSEESYLASGVLLFFLRNAWHEKKQIFKHNLEIVKLMVERWRDTIVTPKEFLFNSINRSQRPDSKDNICGIQLNAIFLANDLVPWTDTTSKIFLQNLLNCLDNELTAVYQPAAQLLGMCLAKLQPNDSDPLLADLRNKLEKLKGKQEKKFTDILYGVHKHYSNLVDSFLVTISNLIPISSGAIKRIHLEMFLSRMDTYGSDVFREIISIGIQDLLKAPEYQLFALHIVNKALANMTVMEVKSILGDITIFAESKKTDCRQILYEMLMFILERYATEDVGMRKEIISILLNGLSDPDGQIQNRLTQFWSNAEHLSVPLDTRLLEMFSKLYEPSSEKYFLSNCAQLLLEPAIQHSDSKRQIFEHQTDEDFKLKEYNINLNWKTQNSAFKVPMFVESQQKQLFTGESLSHSLLKATTSNLAFEPTLDPATMSQTNDSFALQTQSSLLFSDQPQLLDRRSHRLTGSTPTQSITASEQGTFAKFRKRFLRDKERMHKNLALKAIEQHAYTNVIQSQTKMIKERHAVLYRRYRFGDYPDLLINSLALLLPLKALVRCDKIVARQVLVSIFTATCKELDEMVRPFIVSASNFIQSIFVRSKYCDPMVFGALIEIALSNPKYFDLPPDIVAIFANANNMMASGILYLENRLICNWDTGADGGGGGSSSKRSNVSVTAEEMHWLKLSELYRGLAETDIVAGIFADKLQVDDKIPQALEMEQNGDFENAQKHYLVAINRELAVEKDFAYQSYYNCFRHMGNWKSLLDNVHTQLDHIDELWTDPWNMENLLPHIVRTELRQTLAGNAASMKFLNELERWSKSEEKWDYLKMNFAEELMMFHIANRDYRRAKFHAEEYTIGFIAEWPNFNVLSYKIRATKLLDIRTVSEAQKYSDLFLRNEGNGPRIVENLWQRWQHSKPDPCDSTILWDTLIAYRTFICGLASSVSNISIPALVQCINQMTFTLLHLALGQANVKLSDQIITSLSPSANNKDDIFTIEWMIARSKHQAMKSKNRPFTDAMQLYLKAWHRIDMDVLPNPQLVSHPNIHIQALQEIVHIANGVSDLLPTCPQIEEQIKQNIIQLTSTSDSENLNQRLHDYAIQCLQHCVNLAESRRRVKDVSAETIADVHYNLAEYCQDSLQKTNLEQPSIIYEMIVKSILRGMQYGSVKAQQQFPRVLQIPDLNTDELKRLFNKESLAVPEWMFIRWLPQIISILDFDNACYLDQLFIRIAKAYPAAIYYPFQLSFDQYKRKLFETNDDTPMIRSTIGEVQEIVHNKYAGKFIAGLNALCTPEMMLKNHLTKLKLMLGKDINFTMARYVRQIKTIEEIAYPVHGHNLLLGKLYHRIEPFKEELKRLLTYDLHNDKEEIVNCLNDCIDRLQLNARTIDGRQNLQDFCPWLHQFQWYGSEEDCLELPGQYTGDKKPDIQSHIKIVKFSETVQVFRTLRKPIRFSIQGSDGKSYDFLVKYGEDLRQDQRIQQILTLMSKQLASERNCRANKLAIGVFKVIPMNDHCGILSWVPNTISLYDIIMKRAGRHEANAEEILVQVRMEYRQFIEAAATKDVNLRAGGFHDFGNVVTRYSRQEVVNKFEFLVNKIPKDLIKNILLDMGNSPESFFTLRNNFATSLAVMNIAQWILGIGDRNLGNILLCTRTGGLVGIDFGISFGGATRELLIPELIPFRLTPQFVNALNPLGLTGFITQNMIYALRTFRMNKKLLMACMEVFIKEPMIDWLSAINNRNEFEDDRQWEPHSRINIVYQKLNGANPKYLIEKDLTEGVISNYPAYFDGYRRFLRGIPSRNVRAQLKDRDLSVEQQIKCLLDMATDPALLGIMFDWIQPWI